MIALLASIAGFAQEPCPVTDFAEPAETLSVAWISPVRDRVGARADITVVRTTDLRDWVGSEAPSVGRLLQRLGLREESTDPRRRYKVVIFDVSQDALCRPLSTFPQGENVAQVATCDPKNASKIDHYSGCGVLTDRADGSRSFDVYQIEWKEAAKHGFCVLPAERFVQEGGR